MKKQTKYIILIAVCAILLVVSAWATTLTGAFFALAYETNEGFNGDTGKVFALFFTACIGVLVSLVLMVISVVKLVKSKKQATTCQEIGGNCPEEQPQEEQSIQE